MSLLLFALAAFALLIWWMLRRRATVLPGEVVWRDTPDADTLVTHRYRIAGRPDYVVRGTRGLVPVEVKSRACGSHGPYASERAQLLAYCLLIEEALGGAVTSGVLEYRDRQIVVPFGELERQEITALLAQMDDDEHDAHRSHQQVARCRRCGFRARCNEALAGASDA
jgi:CRISPR-associated exonuclease Cas4